MTPADPALPDPDEDRSAPGWAATRAWVAGRLATGERIEAVTRLRGGWTSRMRRLEIAGPAGRRTLVLRSFVKPFYARHARGLLHREADVLRLLAGTEVPAAGFVAVDAAARHCDHPSLLMTLLPGTVRVTDDAEADRRAGLLARQLVAVHGLSVPAAERPRDYEAWTSAERVRPPAGTGRPELWRRAVDVIRRDPPAYRPRFLHRDFHPGNVLFTGSGAGLRISGVVDWVETSWGPADLDVAHCSTTLALLYGVPAGMTFADRYAAAGGVLAGDRAAHLHWRLLDALAFAPDAEKVAGPWHDLGRTDLTPAVLTGRLEDYVQALFDRYERT
ncbi:aminoglycoside phosphotransferase family protein [Streptomyces sp. PvR034]|uniref:phosphotransferase family protein n=1 Tax=Streptomyces sp. PvR034 TaxID=3156401 RepID=UPI003394291B